MNIVPVTQKFSDSLLEISPREILNEFSRPTLLEVPGNSDTTIFLSVLLHGNETSSFRVMQRLLKRYRKNKPEKTMLFFIGNVEAAAKGERRLSGKVDFNRIWKKGERHLLADSVIEHISKRKLFASIDIHNNTGVNPIYACVNCLRSESLALAQRFSEHTVFFIYPDSVQSFAFQEFCPSLTLECGVSEDPEGINRVEELVEFLLTAEELPKVSAGSEEVNVFHTIARAVIDSDAKIGLVDKDLDADIILAENLEKLNFQFVPAGSVIAKQMSPGPCLRIESESGEDITEKMIENVGGELRTLVPIIPSMFTRKPSIIHQDCLGYFMESLEVSDQIKD